MKQHWWKILGVVLVLYAIIGGFLIDVPKLAILHETIRNLYFHVTMWFSMMILLFISLVYSIKYLSGFNIQHDIIASQAAKTGIFFGILGLITGMIWARFTWGAYWVNDPKLNGAAVTLLIYFAYTILRNSLDEEQKRGKVAAVYNIFAYIMLIVFLMILPRMTDSLHPGNGGNPGFGAYNDDLDGRMRMVFYPAIVGWSLLGVWFINLQVRISNVNRKLKYGL